MTVTTYEPNATPTQDELVSLYSSVGWSIYADDPHRLAGAIASSLAVVTARRSGELVGLARLVGDGLTIVYVQDTLINPADQRRGIGQELLRRLLEPYADVRQKVLITDDEDAQRAFYESMGFVDTRDLPYPIRTFTQFG